VFRGARGGLDTRVLAGKAAIGDENDELFNISSSGWGSCLFLGQLQKPRLKIRHLVYRRYCPVRGLGQSGCPACAPPIQQARCLSLGTGVFCVVGGGT
jgi:hypothetical protein